MIDVKIDAAALNRVKVLLGDIKNGYAKALSGAINKTLTTVKVQAKARIGNELNLKASRIEEDLSIDKANYSKLYGKLVASGEPIGLINFGVNQTQKGVSVKVKKSGGRSLLKHAFIAKGRGASVGKDGNTKKHVFWRDRDDIPAPKKLQIGKAAKISWDKMPKNIRYPLYRLTGPRIEDILDDNKVLEPLTIQANYLFASNMEKKIMEILRRHG